MNIKRIQGNSLWINIECESYADIDPIWSNFSGSWKITDAQGLSMGNGALLNLTPDVAGTLAVRVTPTIMAGLLANNVYTITVQIVNTVANYEEERQDTITITKPELIV